MQRREFLMLANKYKREKIAGWWVSEKLDGTRAFWDGGVSRGVPTSQVPWANTVNPKTGESKKVKTLATGLWSRYGNPIIAPDWWLNQLPTCLLDGELFAGRGRFQICRSIVAGDVPGPDWDQIRYCVFGSPAFDRVFGSGEIKNANFTKLISESLIRKWFAERAEAGCLEDFKTLDKPVPFESELQFVLQAVTTTCEVIDVVPQAQLPDDEEEAAATLDTLLDKFLALGGEGLVLRDGSATWEPKRIKGLLKMKPVNDDEGTVTGFVSGRETAKGSKLLGLIGALILDYNGKRLELSGLTNEERTFVNNTQYAIDNPGKDMPVGTQGACFKVGDKITFKFRELSDEGIPKEARYWRKR
ncbi:MAG: hypothetical protein A2Z77_00545 [Chloroflexi bacterium RBG_13_51_36]|nr:MAG: hypothetical protein A2Z77_00545 [Chloroflexi bacterium RBG_13_51_36]